MAGTQGGGRPLRSAAEQQAGVSAASPARSRRRPTLRLGAGAVGAALALALVGLRGVVRPLQLRRGGGGSVLQGALEAPPRAFVAAGSRGSQRHGAASRGAGEETLELARPREDLVVTPRSWEAEKPRPPTLPAGLFKPKQSLSQNFLADPNYVYKMVSAVEDDSPAGRRVLELGPGTGALTTRLFPRFPDMVAVELDQRAMRVLAEKAPGCTVVRSDVLLVNYTKLAELRGGPLTVVGNLPYHVTSQILFTLADHAASVKTAHVTMQKEVAERIVARPNSKKYGILSVAFQLYSNPKILFNIPPTAFFPRPNVLSSYVRFDFEDALERRLDMNVDPRDLRNLTNRAFRERRKMMQNSLAPLLRCPTTLIEELPPEYAKLRPEQIEPWEFVHLTQLMFGKKEFPRHLRRAWRGEFGRTVRD